MSGINEFYIHSEGKYIFGNTDSSTIYLQGMGTSQGICVSANFVMGSNYVNFGSSIGISGYGIGSSGGSIVVKNSGGDWTVITDIGGVSGSNTQVQFNDNGSFGADPNFTWSSGTSTLTVRDTISVSNTSSPSIEKIKLNSTGQGACITMGHFGIGNPTITLNTLGNSSQAMITLEESAGVSVGLELGIEGSDFKGGIISMYETTQGISTLVISGGVSDSTNGYIGSSIEMKRRKNNGTSIITPFTFDAPNLEMVLRNDNSGASVSFGMNTSQTIATNFILPTSDGTNGYVLETDGSGNTSWTAATNSFSTISVDGVDDIVSTSSTDVLILEAGTGMGITADIPNKKVTFTSSGGGGGGGEPTGDDNSIQYKDGVSFVGDASFKFFTQHPTTTGGVSTVTIDGNLFSGMSVIDRQSETPGPYTIPATEFVNGFIFPPCQSSDENQLFVVQVPTYSQIRSNFGTEILKAGQTFDTVIYGTSIGVSAGVCYPSDITVLENTDVIFDRRLASDKTISGGLSFHFADATLDYYQGVVIRSRMGSAGVSMYPYASSFYTC